MVTVKMTGRGQGRIPKEVRKRLGLRAGEVIEIIEGEDGYMCLRKQLVEPPFDRWYGSLTHLAGLDPDEVVREMRDE